MDEKRKKAKRRKAGKSKGERVSLRLGPYTPPPLSSSLCWTYIYFVCTSCCTSECKYRHAQPDNISSYRMLRPAVTGPDRLFFDPFRWKFSIMECSTGCLVSVHVWKRRCSRITLPLPDFGLENVLEHRVLDWKISPPFGKTRKIKIKIGSNYPYWRLYLHSRNSLCLSASQVWPIRVSAATPLFFHGIGPWFCWRNVRSIYVQWVGGGIKGSYGVVLPVLYSVLCTVLYCV